MQCHSFPNSQIIIDAYFTSRYFLHLHTHAIDPAAATAAASGGAAAAAGQYWWSMDYGKLLHLFSSSNDLRNGTA